MKNFSKIKHELVILSYKTIRNARIISHLNDGKQGNFDNYKST